MIKKILIFTFLFITPIFSTSAFALGKASDAVKAIVNDVRQTVSQDKARLTEKQLEKKLQGVIAPLFDFREMSRRSLGAKWRQATEEERVEFVDLFSNLLSTNYIKKIRENIENSELVIKSEQSTSPKTAIVKSVVEYEGQVASVDYRLRIKKGAWRVYDVVVENIGLVSNYRNEFGSIVDKEGISGLLKKLRDKQ